MWRVHARCFPKLALHAAGPIVGRDLRKAIHKIIGNVPLAFRVIRLGNAILRCVGCRPVLEIVRDEILIARFAAAAAVVAPVVDYVVAKINKLCVRFAVRAAAIEARIAIGMMREQIVMKRRALAAPNSGVAVLAFL